MKSSHIYAVHLGGPVQTFLPYANFERSAAVLDRQRLGKQRVETLQIMTALNGGHGWANHPAVRMWVGHEYYLMEYQKAICNEWTSRGYKDTCLAKTFEIYGQIETPKAIKPPWLGLEQFHLAHQSNLIRKDPEHYKALFPGVPDNLPYYWPL